MGLHVLQRTLGKAGATMEDQLAGAVQVFRLRESVA